VLAGLLQRRAEAQRLLPDLESARACIDEALKLLEGRDGQLATEARRACELTLAQIVLDSGDPARAAQLLDAELARLEKEPSAIQDRATAREALSRARSGLGDQAEAERLLRRSVEELDAAGLADSPGAQLTLNTLVSLLYSQKRIGEALPLMERVLATMRRYAGDSHPMIATQVQNLATVMRANGRSSVRSNLP
jgi:tetratricopeptide (TPR) repeat protein